MEEGLPPPTHTHPHAGGVAEMNPFLVLRRATPCNISPIATLGIFAHGGYATAVLPVLLLKDFKASGCKWEVGKDTQGSKLSERGGGKRSTQARSLREQKSLLSSRRIESLWLHLSSL